MAFEDSDLPDPPNYHALKYWKSATGAHDKVVSVQKQSENLYGLPLISGPVSMREPGRFQGKAI